MSEHRATVEWKRSGEFRYETYSRSHELRFDGISVPAAAAPGNIPETSRTNSGVDPEQAFVASLSSCHMLWFLHLACQKKWIVERYVDDAVGVLDKTWVSKVTLRPAVSFSGTPPTIANSVKTEVIVEPCLK